MAKIVRFPDKGLIMNTLTRIVFGIRHMDDLVDLPYSTRFSRWVDQWVMKQEDDEGDF